jgi:ribonuclease HI
MRGWDAVWNGTVPACEFVGAAQEGSSINELELLAAIHGVREFASFARGKQLQIVSDSRVTAHCAQLNISLDSAPVTISNTPRSLRSAKYHTVYAEPAFGAQVVGRPPVQAYGQYKLGPVTEVQFFC